MATLSDAQLAAIEAQLSQNPAILQALQADQKKPGRTGRASTGAADDPRFATGRADLLRQYGIDFPDAGDYQILVDPSGQVKLKRQNFLQRNAEWILPVATFGTAGVGSALAAGGPAATTAGSTAGADFVGPTLEQAGLHTGGTLAGLSTREWVGVGGMAADVAGRWYAQRQADKAAGRQVDQSAAALALEKEMFEKEQARQAQLDAEDKRRYDQDFEEKQRIGERNYADLSPYRNIGSGALSRLAFGVGIPDPTQGNARGTAGPAPSMPPSNAAPSPTPMQPMTGGSLTALAGTPQAANVSQGSMTTMRTPTGQTVLVPAAKVQEAIANGGTVLQGAA